MSYKDNILSYYQKEIDFISKYISKNSNVNQSIDWLNNRSSDPHIQKLIESFAFIAAKLNYKVDYANSDLNKYIIDMLLPQFNRPIPSTCVVSLNIDNFDYNLPEVIPAYTEIESNGMKFKTLYNIDIIPFEIHSINISMARELGLHKYNNKSNWFMKIKLYKTHESSIPDKIRFYINKNNTYQQLIYEMILSNSQQDFYIIEDDHSIKRINGSANNITNDFAFKDNSELFNINLSSGKFKILHDYVIMKEKFMFFDIAIGEVNITNNLEIIIPISDTLINEDNLEIDKESLQLMCSPVINLYKIKSAPIEIDNQSDKYIVKPYNNNRNSIIYSIKNIESISNKNLKYLKYLYDGEKDKHLRFWSHIRDKHNDCKIKSYVNIVDIHNQKQNFDKDIVIGNLICCDYKINIGLEQKLFLDKFNLTFQCLYTPSRVSFIPHTTVFNWHLISNLVKNHIGIMSKKFMQEDEFICDITYIKNLIKIYQSVLDISLIGIENTIISSECKKSYSIEIFNGVQCFISTLFINLRVDDKMQFKYNVLLFSKVLSDIFKKSAPFNTKVIVNIIKDSDSSLWIKYV